MKVGITTYPVAFQRKGGLEVQIRQTIKALSDLGVNVEIVDLSRKKLTEYDLIHHFSHSSIRILQTAKSFGVPCVLSPLVELVQSDIRLQKIRFVSYCMHRVFGHEFHSRWDDVIETLRLADAVLPLTRTEQNVIEKLCTQAASKITVVPNGITEDFFSASPELFQKTYPEIKRFVLIASSIVPYKNQLSVIKAACAEGYHCVLVGSKSSENYFTQSMQAGGDKVTYLGEMIYPSPILTSLFSAAGVVVLASKQEPFGMVPFEGLAAGTPSILTTVSGVERASEAPYFQRVNPYDIEAIRKAIRLAMEASPSASDCRNLVEDMKWSAVAKIILNVYESVLADNTAS